MNSNHMISTRIKRCGVKHSIGLICDREIGHPGPHRGYHEVIDEPLFWQDKPPGVTGSQGSPRGSSDSPQG